MKNARERLVDVPIRVGVDVVSVGLFMSAIVVGNDLSIFCDGEILARPVLTDVRQELLVEDPTAFTPKMCKWEARNGTLRCLKMREIVLLMCRMSNIMTRIVPCCHQQSSDCASAIGISTIVPALTHKHVNCTSRDCADCCDLPFRR